MGKYRKYRQKNHYNSQALDHVLAFKALENKLGPAVTDVKKSFFNLSSGKLDQLLLIYKEEYGFKPYEYALQTIPKWRDGRTKMSGQTMERLLNLVPKFLTDDERFEITKSVCEHFSNERLTTEYVNIDLENIDTGLIELERKILKFHSPEIIKSIPEKVVEVAVWLNDNDSIASRALIAKVEGHIAHETKIYGLESLEEIRNILLSGKIDSYRESFQFPNGILYVTAFKKSKCFIATSVYGDSFHPKVLDLRKIRDNVLLKKTYGREFIYRYYLYGELVANQIEKSSLALKLSRFMLDNIINIYNR